MPLPYRDFHFPLNALMHVLTLEEGDVRALHYGIFDSPGETIRAAQERSTELILSKLPPAPARVLDVGVGIATTLARLTAGGWTAEGITPDEQQIVYTRLRHGDALPIFLAAFETFEAEPYDCVFFQESSQYIAYDALFRRAAALTSHVVVLDEFATRPVEVAYALPELSSFLRAAETHGFALVDELDVTDRAAPTVDYFNMRIPKHRGALISDLGLTEAQVDALEESGARYRQLFADRTYVYRLMELRKALSSP